MLQTLVATFVVLGIIVVAMAVGVIFGRPALRGSCGGDGTACTCSSADQAACETRKQAGELPAHVGQGDIIDVARLRR